MVHGICERHNMCQTPTSRMLNIHYKKRTTIQIAGELKQLLVFNAQPTGTVIKLKQCCCWCQGLLVPLIPCSLNWLVVGCLTSQQHDSVSRGPICSDKCRCCHTETEVKDQTFYLTKPQYIDTRPTSPSTDPIMPGTLQGSHWSANF